MRDPAAEGGLLQDQEPFAVAQALIESSQNISPRHLDEPGPSREQLDAMLSLVIAGSIREWVLRQVAVYCRPLSDLAVGASKRERYRLHLLDALDMIADERAVRRAEDGVRDNWMRRAAA